MSLKNTRWHTIWAYLPSPEPSYQWKKWNNIAENSELEGMHKDHCPEYTTHLKFWNFLELLELSMLMILYTISYLFWRTLLLYSRKKPSDRVRNKTYLKFHQQNLKQLITSGSFLRACGWSRLATFLSVPLLVSMCTCYQ